MIMEDIIFQLIIFVAIAVLALVFGLNGKWLDSDEDSVPSPKESIKYFEKSVPPPPAPRAFPRSHLDGAILKKVTTEVLDLPRLYFFENVYSTKEIDAVYSVSGGNQTCTCLNFEKRRQFPINDMRRWCKHLISEMDNYLAFEDVSKTNRIVLSTVSGGGPFSIYEYDHPELPIMFFTVGESDEWLNVLARQKLPGETVWQASGEYARFGWSCFGRRWSYGDGVPGASKVRLFLRHIGQLSDLEKYADKN